MIDVHYWPTPNGHKITIFLEETGTPYQIVPVNIGRGDQFKPEFLAISPNNRMPAIVDHEPKDGGPPISLFESGAILTYLAEKTGRFLPTDLRARLDVLAWTFWQVANLGPMAGQKGHFARYAPEKIPYAIDRYTKEVSRLHAVLDKRLHDRAFMCGEYSIADMATYPWVGYAADSPEFAAEFPNVKRWVESIRARPAVVRAYAKAETVRPKEEPLDDEARKVLFGQSADTIRNR
jgi:GST-like protein